ARRDPASVPTRRSSDLSTIETGSAEQAGRTLSEWADRGYLPEGANATSDSDAQAAFANGGSAFLVTGNWAASELSEEMGDNVGRSEEHTSELQSRFDLV